MFYSVCFAGVFLFVPPFNFLLHADPVVSSSDCLGTYAHIFPLVLNTLFCAYGKFCCCFIVFNVLYTFSLFILGGCYSSELPSTNIHVSVCVYVCVYVQRNVCE